MVYHYDKLIVGGTLSAYACAFVNHIPIIHLSTVDYCPFPWDFFPSGINWTRFGFPNQDCGLITNKGIQSRGLQKLLLYGRFASIVGLSGLAPFAGTITKIEINREKKQITLALNENRTVLLTYNKLYVFDSFGVDWDLEAFKKNNYYIVSDWFDVHKSMRHSFDVILDQEDNPFVWRIFYHMSDRTSGALKSMKWLEYIHSAKRSNITVDRDLCAVSYLR